MKIAYVGMDLLGSGLVYLSARPDVEVALVVSGEPNHPCGGVRRHARVIGAPCLTAPDDETLLEGVRDAGCRLLICAAYHRRLPASALEAAGVAPLNVHPSLLPEGKGPSPIARFALSPEDRAAAGLSLHLMTDAYDDGPVALREPIALAPEDGYDAIEAKMFAAVPKLLARFLADVDGALAAAQKQEGGAYWPRPSDAERTLKGDATVAEAREIARKVGGYGVRIELLGDMHFSARPLSITETAHNFPVGGLVLFDGKIATIALKDGILRVALF